MIIRKAFKYRVYPNAQQEKGLAIQFGHARYVYNHFLAVRQDHYKAHKDDEGKKGLTYAETNKLLTALKHTQECAWLQEADSQALQESLRNLDKAYQAFFAKRSGYPKFKKKSHDQSVHYPQRFWMADCKVYAPKVGEIKAVIHRLWKGPQKPDDLQNPNRQIFCIDQCEIEIPDPAPKNGEVGIDLGLTHFATLTTKEQIDHPDT